MTIRRGEPVRDHFRTHRSAAATMTVTSGRRQRKRVHPVRVTRPHPLAWQVALALAKGDARRLRAQPDGSVLVSNSGLG